ncbi:streptogrisin C [Herbihabitans rhizosphaerae]|uniref:Streptogrisin C n=1 Tax=Herbihabitans rhizosphaerae TaxID=1872711 RepID=A0A4Q7L0U0_9PSEU|nr:S1 family peptidase [Herbihabitans rhizosphaerae]RZS43079.1 streptogrisin C [Herbihabitans rhizosphaerae]
MAGKALTTLTAALLVSGVALAITPSAAAAPTPDPDMFSALQRDLSLTAEAAGVRLDNESRAATADRSLRKRHGDRLGGSWFDGDKLVVAVTDTTLIGAVRDAGAEAKVVTRSERELDRLKAAMDSRKGEAPRTIPGWFVDVTSNTITVQSRAHATDAAREFVAASGVPADAVRIVHSDEIPRPLIDVVGGNAYYIGSGTRCSVGFTVNGGFVTAGHCGRTGATTSQPSGSFAGSSFPGNDYAHVRVAAGNNLIGAVNNYAGGRVAVAGSQDAPVGSSICRSGSTTGWRCGTIQARNASVTYPQGTVSGLIRTNACAEPGDSGGSAISGSQAQGVTSGGSGNCSSGGTTFFQPVNEILQTYGLTLITDGGNPPGEPCTGSQNTYNGSVAQGATSVQPNGSNYQSTAAGTHSGCLDGPDGADFDLYLQKWNGSSWAEVASGTSPGPDETVDYNGTAGYYRWVVHAYSGSGNYTLGTRKP